jgi:hypothetical protein
MTGPSQFVLGLVMGVGGTVFCVALGFLGSVLGHGAGERHIARVRSEVDEVHGDVPTLPRDDCGKYLWFGDMP